MGVISSCCQAASGWQPGTPLLVELVIGSDDRPLGPLFNRAGTSSVRGSPSMERAVVTTDGGLQ
jgi:hypothetical protein